MAYLNFISDDDLINECRLLLKKARARQIAAEKDIEKNVVDPFSYVFESVVYDETFEEWKKNETRRQVQKTLSNALGDFHQNILGKCNGWENLKQQDVFDLRHTENKIIAEVKNKHNTIKASDRCHNYDAFENTIQRKDSRYRGYTAYLVEVVPNKARYNKPFTPSRNTDGTRSYTE